MQGLGDLLRATQELYPTSSWFQKFMLFSVKSKKEKKSDFSLLAAVFTSRLLFKLKFVIIKNLNYPEK